MWLALRCDWYREQRTVGVTCYSPDSALLGRSEVVVHIPLSDTGFPDTRFLPKTHQTFISVKASSIERYEKLDLTADPTGKPGLFANSRLDWTFTLFVQNQENLDVNCDEVFLLYHSEQRIYEMKFPFSVLVR